MDQLPKYSYDLIDLLDAGTPRPQFPTTMGSAIGCDERAVRQGIWLAAQRALVDELVAAREELDAEVEDTNPESPPDPFGQVLDPDGKQHRNVASVHLAGSHLEDDDYGVHQQLRANDWDL